MNSILIVWVCSVAVAAQGDAAGDAAHQEAVPAPAYRQAALIRLEGMVSPMMQAFLERKLDVARQRGADLIILDIESPGGYLHTTKDMGYLLRDYPWARTVALIEDQALSGAAITALACDEIVMYPNARLGDAGPIIKDLQDGVFRHAEEKVLSDLAQFVRDLAESKNRSPALAEAMVDRNLVVRKVTHRETGETAYWSPQELASAADADQWEQGPPVFETREAKFLTVNGRRAVELGLADATITRREELVARYGLTTPIIELRPTAVDTTVYYLNQPVVTGLLFVIGLVALLVELSAPGISIGGLISGLCFALFFWSRVLGGTSTWLEIILFVAGLIFLGIEIFVFPGFGVAGIMGILLMLVSVVMASQNFVIPQTGREMSVLATSVAVVAVSGVAFLFIAFAFSHWMGDVPLLNRLALSPPTSSDELTDAKDAKQPTAALVGPVAVGDWGVAESPLRPAGRAKFGLDFVDVVADGSYVAAGEQIRVVAIEGNRVVVRPVEQA